MGVRIFRTMYEYVEHITEIERESAPTLVASSFLSSHLFPKSSVMRFFVKDLGDEQTAKLVADQLWKRRRYIRTNIRREKYFEVYEMEAFEEFCNSGTVHRQSPNFRATPNEIASFLQAMLDLMKDVPRYHLALCREVLPFVFIVKPGKGLTIDVRNNFGYQRIQGLLLQDGQVIAEFEKEFWRIWQEHSTLSDQSEVRSLIENKIALVMNSARFLANHK